MTEELIVKKYLRLTPSEVKKKDRHLLLLNTFIRIVRSGVSFMRTPEPGLTRRYDMFATVTLQGLREFTDYLVSTSLPLFSLCGHSQTKDLTFPL